MANLILINGYKKKKNYDNIIEVLRYRVLPVFVCIALLSICGLAFWYSHKEQVRCRRNCEPKEVLQCNTGYVWCRDGDFAVKLMLKLSEEDKAWSAANGNVLHEPE